MSTRVVLLPLLDTEDLDSLRRAVRLQPVDPFIADFHLPIVTTMVGGVHPGSRLDQQRDAT